MGGRLKQHAKGKMLGRVKRKLGSYEAPTKQLQLKLPMFMPKLKLPKGKSHGA